MQGTEAKEGGKSSLQWNCVRIAFALAKGQAVAVLLEPADAMSATGFGGNALKKAACGGGGARPLADELLCRVAQESRGANAEERRFRRH